MHETVAILHNIRSAHNVGSIFRTCDAAGIARVFLTAHTPTPLHTLAPPQTDVPNPARGAERTVGWEQYANVRDAIQKLRDEGFQIIGVELDDRAVDYRQFVRAEKSAFIFGNEVRGLSPALRDACDALVEIPMRGTKESLNVSVSAGVILFALQ